MADRARGNASAGRRKGKAKATGGKAASAARTRRPAAAKAGNETKGTSKRGAAVKRATSATRRGGAKAPSSRRTASGGGETKRQPGTTRARKPAAVTSGAKTRSGGKGAPAKRSRLGSVATAVRGRVAGAVAAVKRTVSGRRVPDAITLLEADHRRMEDLLKRGEETTERGVERRKELLDTIVSELAAHEMIEEKVFYPALQSHPEARDIVLEGFEEHHVADVVVKELGEMAADKEQWGAKFKVLQETIQHHIDEEEGEMFRTARAVLGQDELDALGREMAGLKARARES